MLAVHLENRRVEVRDVRRPARRPGFALIRLVMGGICNTDLELQRGYYGFRGIPGHEFVGEVIAADSGKWIGRRVVGEINLGCGLCEWCRSGMRRHCPKRSVLGIVRHAGAFQEFLTLPEENLHLVPEEVSSEEAVFVEPLAAACEILEQVPIPAGTEVAVLGDGKLGLLIAQVLQSSGQRVHLYGRHKENFRVVRGLGIETYAAGKRMPEHAYDWVIDATGSAQGLQQAVTMVRPRGTVFLKSTIHGLVPVDTAPIIVNEITLIGSRCGRFEPALQLLRSGRLNVVDMISDKMSLSEARRAFARASERGVLKVLLKTD